jgi:hypothetical protein
VRGRERQVADARRPPLISSQCQARFAVVVGSCRCRRRLSASTIYATSSNAPTVDRRCLLCAVADSSAFCYCSSCSCPHPARACRACPQAAAPQLHPHRSCAVHLAALLLTGLAAPPARRPSSPVLARCPPHRTAPHPIVPAAPRPLASLPRRSPRT